MKTNQIAARYLGDVTPALNFQKQEKASQPEKLKPAESKAVEKEKPEEEQTGVKDSVEIASPISATVTDKKSDKTDSQPRQDVKTPGRQAKAFYSTINTDAEGYALENDDARRKNPIADIGGLSIGAALEYGLAVTGPVTELHEGAHALMVKSFYKNPSVTVQVDGTDNVKNLMKDPSFKNLGRVLTGYDANQDGAAGVTRYSYGDGLNETGQALGQDNVRAIVAAAGCVAEEIPVFMGFAAGFKLRKKFPLLGYSLMSLSGMHHLTTSVYPLSALWTTTAESPGHDWASFAKSTGIHPAITATVFAASLPTMGAAMWFMEKHAENQAKNRLAVANLIQKGKISVPEMDDLYKGYKRSSKLEKAQDRLAEVMEKPFSQLQEDKKTQKELKKALANVRKEYNKFSDFLADKFEDRVEEEKSILPKPPKMTVSESLKQINKELKETWKKDKVGTTLTTATIAGSGALLAKSAVETVSSLTGKAIAGAGGAAMSTLLPGVSILGTGATTWRAAQTLKDPNADKIDKTAAVSTAFFSALGTAGVMVPGLGLPAMLISISGLAGTMAAKAIARKIAG